MTQALHAHMKNKIRLKKDTQSSSVALNKDSSNDGVNVRNCPQTKEGQRSC
jgi:hypothetical protein